MADKRAIIERLESIFNGMAELKVITAVGPVTLTFPEESGRTVTRIDTDRTPITDAIVTIFDMVDGDVTNLISPNLKDDESLRTFHALQVEKSLTVLPGNIKALVDLGRSLVEGFR